MCTPLVVSAASSSSGTIGNVFVDVSKRDESAVYSVDIAEKEWKETRMGSITAGKTQVMDLTADKLSEGKYLNTFGDKYLPAKSATYWAVCTEQTSGTYAKVGLVYYDAQGQLCLQSSRTLYGYDSYGMLLPNTVYKNYGYIENVGTGTLKASYVILKENE